MCLSRRMETKTLRKTELTTFIFVALVGSAVSTTALARGSGDHFGGGGFGAPHIGGATFAGTHLGGMGLGHFGSVHVDGTRMAAPSPERCAGHVGRRDFRERHDRTFTYGDYCNLPYYPETNPWAGGMLAQ
jgi:hypothetical protein